MSTFDYNDITKTITGRFLEGAVRGLESVLDFTVDYEKSQFNPRVSRVQTDKGLVTNLRWCQTLRKLVSLGGGVLADNNEISREIVNNKYIIRLGEKTSAKVEVIEKHKEEDEITPEATVPEEVVVYETPKDLKPIPSHYVPVQKPDLKYAQSLLVKGKEKESRKVLDKYAEAFGIKLNGRKTFANMMKDFKAAVEEK